MLKRIITATSLVLLLAGPAGADSDKSKARTVHKRPPAALKFDNTSKYRSHDDRGRGHDRDHDRRDWRDDDRHDRDWRRDDWRDHDWRRDDDWRRRGWHDNGWRSDGWRHYRWHDNRHWRYVPPYRYGLDFGYRSGYELAWRDWLSHGRFNRHWRRSSFYGYGVGNVYRSGYAAGWRDAALYYGRGYRPSYWAYDPHGGWYFSFSIAG